ncbi:signal peptidase I [uncultured Methanobacterium sp.]|uniref:signal peptidase I n=1 Tax=uncultured Methanobacterium sp. TaxID=176306 RepID=UPI002AA74991|nr:signal peptidase I [uncultured Methanobacterium sp.]
MSKRSVSFLKEILIALPIVIIVAIIASQLVVVPTESMKPTINEGDMVLVAKTDVLGLFTELNPEDVKVGDIIIYEEESSGESSGGYNEESAIIHRVVEVKEVGGKKYFVLKGDNNNATDDEDVSVDQVKGRTVMWGNNPITIPQVGWVILWFKGTGNETESGNTTGNTS